MMRALITIAPCLPGVVLAAPWTFGDPTTVAGDSDPPHYHHLDGAGRQHIAASDAEVAIVWEDDHSGTPQVYLAAKRHSDGSFSPAKQLSDGKEAYEPSIAAIGKGRWLAAWEQDGAVAARVIDADGLGPVSALAGEGSPAVTIDPRGDLHLVWIERDDLSSPTRLRYMRGALGNP